MRIFTFIAMFLSFTVHATPVPFPDLDVPTYCFEFTANYGMAPSGCFQVDPSEEQTASELGLTEVTAFAYKFTFGDDVVWDDIDNSINDRLSLSFDGTRAQAPLTEYFYIEDNNDYDFSGDSPYPASYLTLLITDSYWQIVDENAVYTERVLGDGVYSISRLAVPIPSAIWLFSSALLMLLGISKKRLK